MGSTRPEVEIRCLVTHSVPEVIAASVEWQCRSGLGEAGPEAPVIFASALRLDPGSRVSGSGADTTGDCGASLRYHFSREAPQPTDSPSFHQRMRKREAGIGASLATAFLLLCTVLVAVSPPPGSAWEVRASCRVKSRNLDFLRPF